MDLELKEKIKEILKKDISTLTDDEKKIFLEIDDIEKLIDFKNIFEGDYELFQYEDLLPKNISRFLSFRIATDDEFESFKKMINLLRKDNFTSDDIRQLQDIPDWCFIFINPNILTLKKNASLNILSIEDELLIKEIYCEKMDEFKKLGINNLLDFVWIFSVDEEVIFPQINLDTYRNFDAIANFLNEKKNLNSESLAYLEQIVLDNIQNIPPYRLLIYIKRRFERNEEVNSEILSYLKENLQSFVSDNPELLDSIPDSFITDELFSLAIAHGYEVDFGTSKKILSNPRYIKMLVDANQLNVLNYVLEDGLNDEIVKMAIDKGYVSSCLDRFIKKSSYIMLFIDALQFDVINYVDPNLITEDIVSLLIEKGYQIGYNPKNLATNKKFIKMFIEDGQPKIINGDSGRFVDEELLALAIQNGYKIDYDTPDYLKKNTSFTRVFIESGDVNAINKVYTDGLDEECISLAINNGYEVSYEASSNLLSNPKYVEIFIRYGQLKILDYVKAEGLTEEIVDLAIQKGYKISYSSSLCLLSDLKYIRKFWDSGQNDVFNYIQGGGLDDEFIDLIIKRGLKVGSSFFRSLSNHPEFIKKFIVAGDIEVISVCSIDDLNSIQFNINSLLTTLNNININEAKIECLLYLYSKFNKIDEKNDSNVTDIFDNLYRIIYKKLVDKFHDESIVREYLEKVKNGSTEPLRVRFLNNLKDLKYVVYYDDIESLNAANANCGITDEIFDRANKKQIRILIRLLKGVPVSEANIPLLSINMYMSIGFLRAQDLLINRYGKVNEEKLMIMFKNVIPSNCLFEADGKKYKPEINEQLINLIFGKNYNIKNTPIRNFLENYGDISKEIDRQKERIRNDLSLTKEERDSELLRLDQQLSEYQKNLSEFFQKFYCAINNWDIIEEEYLKSTSVSSLKSKLSLSKLLELINAIETMNKCPELGPRDELLAKSDVFDYAYADTKFVSDVKKVPGRIITLSRRMDSVKTKKFPNVSLKQGKYTIKVYGPQDRRILSAGYRSNCCFRACGNADNSGNDNSLLNYCVSTEYGGGVEIFDEDGNTVMFSPLLRNGNVLMIHSIETKLMTNLPNECYELLQKFSQTVIDKSLEQGDDISFVTITDLHYLNQKYTRGVLPMDMKFSIYDEKNAFDGIYTNLNCSHMILASREGRTFNDISYGRVDTDYSFDIPNIGYTVQLPKDVSEIISRIETLNQEYIELSNRRSDALQNGKDREAYQLLVDIRGKKRESLELYKYLIKVNASDIYAKFKNIYSFVYEINEKLNISQKIDISLVSDVMCESDWYIIITHNGDVISNCLDSGREKLDKKLHELGIDNRKVNVGVL